VNVEHLAARAALEVVMLTQLCNRTETYVLMLAGLGLVGFMARRKKSEVRI
jgi:hypothetical protein